MSEGVPSALRTRRLPTLPGVARYIGIAIAVVIGWSTSVGASMAAFWLGWNALYTANLSLVAFTPWLDIRWLLMPYPRGALSAYVDIGMILIAALSLLGVLMYLTYRPVHIIKGMVRSRVERASPNSDLGVMVRQVAQRSGVRFVPSVWMVHTSCPLAFATSAPFGRQAVVISSGLLSAMPTAELRFVFAHEIAHLYYRDTSSAVIWLTSVRSMHLFLSLRQRIGRMLLQGMHGWPGVRLLIAVPISVILWVLHTLSRLGLFFARQIFTLTDRWASRHMEFRADLFAAKTAGPAAGAQALARLKGDAEPTFNGLFATHPPIRERIARLREISRA